MAKKMNASEQAEYNDVTAALNKMSNLGDVAVFISCAWEKVHYTAAPYLDAMGNGQTFDPKEPYSFETQGKMVVHFLSNSSSWRGPAARATRDFLTKKYVLY